ncbi:MAG: TonB-dependent receptor [Dysgonamonadaceae bacterium]|jgi:hypothetical protein|nr:TonB-dependent receptor [Dysgonamonadaceae bacterium]
MSFKFLYISLIFFFSITGLFAQTTLSGEIEDRAGKPVPGASVSLGAGFLRTVSNNDGEFSFVYPDTLTNRSLQFEAFGYKRKKVNTNRGQQHIKVMLIDSIFNLQNVVVSAPKYGRFSDYSAQTIKMSTFDVVTNPAAMADMSAAMRVLPGVQANDNDGRLIVQGGSPGESQYYINDLLVVDPYNLSSTGTGVRSRFTSDLFDGVVLQSGGYNAEFGQALSGIINLNTKERTEMTPKTDISVSSVYAGITHTDQKPSYAYRASLRYSNLEPYGKLFPDKLEWNDYFQSLQGDFFLTKEFNLKTKMTVQANFSREGLECAYYNVDTVRFTNRFNQDYFYAQANLYHAFDVRWSLSLASNVVANRFSGTEMQRLNDRVENLNSWNHNKLGLQYRQGRIVNRSGIEWINNSFEETYTFDREYKTQINSQWMSLYNDTKLFIGNKLTANIGLRGEYSFYLRRFNLAPRLYLGYALNTENIFSMSVGRYFQLPDMDYLKQTNTLDFASVNKATLSYSYVKQTDKFQLDTYRKKYDKVPVYSQGTMQPANIHSEGEGYAWGADVFWKSNFKTLSYWLTYSYNHTKKQYERFTERVTPDYVSPHVFNIVLKYWIAPLRSQLGTSYNISAGIPYYMESPPYDRLGKTPFRNRLDMSWSYLPSNQVIIHFGLQNVLGYTNIYGYRYSEKHPGLRKEITSNSNHFLFLGVFITLSNDKNLNQLKLL